MDFREKDYYLIYLADWQVRQLKSYFDWCLKCKECYIVVDYFLTRVYNLCISVPETKIKYFTEYLDDMCIPYFQLDKLSGVAKEELTAFIDFLKTTKEKQAPILNIIKQIENETGEVYVQKI